ncbi:MAG: hypothetical protein R3C10_13950 [Pirellulales bacterium]
MTPLVVMIASMLTAPSAEALSPAPSAEQRELVITLDAQLVSTLESGGDIVGPIPDTARDATLYRLELSSRPTVAPVPGQVKLDHATDTLQLLIPVDANNLERLSSGIEIVGEIPASAREAGAYRLKLAEASSDKYAVVQQAADVSWRGAEPASRSGLSTTSYQDFGTAAPGAPPGPYRTTAPPSVAAPSYMLPGPERTNTFAPSMMSVPVTAANVLSLPPPPSEAASMRTSYTVAPHVTGLLNLPPPPGAQPVASSGPSLSSMVAPGGMTSTGLPSPGPSSSGLESVNIPRSAPPMLAEQSPLTPTGPQRPAFSSMSRQTASAPTTATKATDDAPVGINVASAAPSLPKMDVPEIGGREPPEETKNLTSEESKPWGVLSMFLLGLLISLGANIFLGWIAWDHRGRYQKLVDKMRREKSLRAA